MNPNQPPSTPMFGNINTQNKPNAWFGSTNQTTNFGNQPAQPLQSTQPTSFNTFGQNTGFNAQSTGIFGTSQNQTQVQPQVIQSLGSNIKRSTASATTTAD